ncbi:MAG: thiamine-monophosphate kinase [Planctomycetaceae bacterium]|nr:thiamine-monophosphate kinase [Planctomycetaceae bacterium]
MSGEPTSGEFAFIDWVRRQNVFDGERLPVGIGDDAAVLRPTPGRDLVIAKDVLLEGVHFTFPEATPELAGRKSLAVNLSDLAAMGARPTLAFVGLALPRKRGHAFSEQVHAGIQQLADEFDIVIAGGDTNIWDGPLVVSVTLVGDVEQGQAVRRGGAQAGDWIMVTGPLGGSLPSGRHLTFTPRVELAQQLCKSAPIHSMIDLSDGLSRDVRHLTIPFGLGAELSAVAIPIHDDVASALSPAYRLDHALHDGEDFELLFTVGPEQGRQLLATFSEFPLAHIGTVTATPTILLKLANGISRQLPVSGWEHRYERS